MNSQEKTPTRNHPGFRRVVAALLIAGLPLAGCASFPEQADIAAFGKAASTIADAGKLAYATDSVLATKVLQQEGLYRYLSNQNDVTLAGKLTAIPAREWQARLALLGAIGTYAAALAKVSDPDAAVKAAASGKLVAANIVSFANALPGASSAAFGKAAPVVASVVIGAATSAFLSRRMRAVIAQTDPDIQQAAALLSADFEILGRRPERDATFLTNVRKELLQHYRSPEIPNRPRLNDLQLRDAYAQFLADEQETVASIKAISNLPEAITKLAAAHHGLLTSFDRERQLAEFVAAANAIGTLFSIPALPIGAEK